MSETTLDYAVAPTRKRASRIVGGLAVVGIVAVLISIMTPSLCRSRETANRVKCASNLRMIAQGMLLYAATHGNSFPDSFATLVRDPDSDFTGEVFTCPSSSDERAPDATTPAQLAEKIGQAEAEQALPGPTTQPAAQWLSYVYCGRGFTTGNASADVILAYEKMENHSGDGMNMLFADGHVEFMSRRDAVRIIDELSNGHNPPRPLDSTASNP